MARRATQKKSSPPILAAVPATRAVGPRKRPSKPPTTAAPPKAGEEAAVLQQAAGRLAQIGESLEKALAEVPRAADFEPLAEHLYEFARQAPALGTSLQELPRVAVPLAQSVKALQDISETLQHANHSFGEALLQMPRPEEYEPLAEPLREFARVAPALAEAMRDVLAVAAPLATLAAPLAESVRGLAVVAGTLETTGRSLEAASLGLHGTSTAPAGARGPNDDLRLRVESAYEAVLEALASLPRASDYEPAAAQLREIASVSPSLLAWLGEVPVLSAPLTDSVRALQKAAADLKAARGLLTSE
jgi:hypothetical protein